MDSSIHILQKTRAGLDRNVWFIMTGFIFLCAVLLCLRIFAGSHVCQPFDIIINRQIEPPTSFSVNETITFSAVGIEADAKKISWTFGDRTKDSGRSVMHNYPVEGRYPVIATFNGKCIQQIFVSIVRPMLSQPQTASAMVNPIVGPDVAVAASTANFSSSVAATSYEWIVLNSPDFRKQDSSMATFKFPTSGIRVIELRLDGDPNKVFKKTIQVISGSDNVDASLKISSVVIPKVVKSRNIKDVPEAPPLSVGGEGNTSSTKSSTPVVTSPPVTKTVRKMIVPDEEFRRMFEELTQGTKSQQDFNEFLCNEGDTKVMANGSWTTLSGVCGALYKEKKMKIKSVSIERDTQNCVVLIRIEYKKKGLF
ncbi:MAG: PKD domain-containing protein [Chitinophagaceae bacterium]